MGSNPSYLLKSFLLYSKSDNCILLSRYVVTIGESLLNLGLKLSCISLKVEKYIFFQEWLFWIKLMHYSILFKILTRLIISEFWCKKCVNPKTLSYHILFILEEAISRPQKISCIYKALWVKKKQFWNYFMFM